MNQCEYLFGPNMMAFALWSDIPHRRILSSRHKLANVANNEENPKKILALSHEVESVLWSF